MSRKRKAVQTPEGKCGTNDKGKDTNRYINNNQATNLLWDEAAIVRAVPYCLCLFKYHPTTGGVELLKFPVPREKRGTPKKFLNWCIDTASRKARGLSFSEMTLEEYVEDFAARRQGKESPIDVTLISIEEYVKREKERRAWMN